MSNAADRTGKVNVAGRKTLASIAWVYAAFLVEKFSTLVTTAILARLLVPEDFGLIASAMLVIGLLTTFRDLGVPEAVIYFGDRPEETNSTSFWIHAGLGLSLASILFFGAPLIVHALGGDDELASVLRAMSPALFFGALGFTHVALIQKHLYFSRRATVDFITAALKAAVTIALALAGWKLWAIVYGYVFASAFRSIALWIALPFRPHVAFSRRRAAEMLNYGKHIFGEGLLSNLVVYADQIAILGLFGSGALAYYYIAARVPELIIYQIATVLTTVLFPTISNLRKEPGAIQNFIVEATRILAYVIYPISLGLAVTAAPLLETLFGAAWTDSAPYLVVLALRGLAATSLWIVGDGLKAIGRPDKLLQITLIETLIAVPLCFVLAKVFGTPLAACFGVLVAMLLANVQRLVEAKRLLGVAPGRFFAASFPSAAAAILMAGCVMAIEGYLVQHTAGFRLAVEVAAGAVVYCGVLWMFDRDRIKGDIAHLAASRADRRQ